MQRLKARKELYEQFSRDNLERIALNKFGGFMKTETMTDDAIVEELLCYDQFYIEKYGYIAPIIHEEDVTQ